MSHITTHVLDVSLGRPAANVAVILEAQSSRGRLRDWPAAKAVPAGTYRLMFDTRAHFASRKIETLYPQVVIVFEVRDAQEHYHIPLLLSPFGYSTYRGS